MRSAVLISLILLSLGINNSLAADKPNTESFNSAGTKISYSIQGKGEPVLLIHGWLSNSGINWMLPGTSGLLAKSFQVITIDVRGHGLSDKPTKVDAYGMELVDDIARLLDHLEIKKAHIVGYSMGGIITAKFLAKYPNRALSGTLAGSGWLREGSIEQKVFAAGGKDGKPVGLCFQSLAKLALTETEIKSITVPVMMIVGNKDELKALYVDPLHKLRNDWPVIEVPDANHLTCILHAQFRNGLETWLKKNSKMS